MDESTRGRHGPRGQHGQATPLLALLMLTIGGLTFGVIRFGADVSRSAQAQAAADASALAAAAEGAPAAEALARANGASLEDIVVAGRTVEVLLRVGDAWAVARASRTAGGGITGWVGVDGAGGAGRSLPQALRVALSEAATLLGQPVPISWTSGSVVVVPPVFVARLDGVAGRVGLCRSSEEIRPVRFAVCRVRSR